MATRVTDGARRERRVSRLHRSRARALLSLNLKKKRDCLQSTIPILKSNYLSVQLLEVKSLKCSLSIYSYFDRRRITINSNNNSNNNCLLTAFP